MNAAKSIRDLLQTVRFYLTIKEITPVIVSEKKDNQPGSYYVKIQSEISSIDFIRAEIENLELKKKETGFSFNMEMQQPLAPEIEPGKELSRAYRYIREEEWRISIIYLDHLEKKYPNWGEVFLAKAIALYSTGDKAGMTDALKHACRLDNQEACDELESFGSNSQ